MVRTDLMTASTGSIYEIGMVAWATRAMGRSSSGDEERGASIDEVDISLLVGNITTRPQNLTLQTLNR